MAKNTKAFPHWIQIKTGDKTGYKFKKDTREDPSWLYKESHGTYIYALSKALASLPYHAKNYLYITRK